MAGLKMTEILLVLAVIMLLFGASRLPALGSSLGSAIRNFKRGFAGDEEDEKAAAAKLAGSTGVGDGTVKAKDADKA